MLNDEWEMWNAECGMINKPASRTVGTTKHENAVVLLEP